MSKADQLAKALKSAAGTPLVILLAGYPDPDSIGSAFAHQLICKQFGVPATIAHIHPVSRFENRAMVKLLDIDMTPIHEPRDLAGFEALSLVDCNLSDPTLELPDHLRLLSVVDHHRVPTDVEAQFVDIRSDVGATSTVYAQYLEAGILPFGREPELHSRVATALLYGITTDTDGYVLATLADHRAASYLTPYADGSILRQIASQSISPTSMQVLERALAGLEVVGRFAVAGVGPVPQGDRDAIGFAADLILRRAGIDTVLVYGVVGDRIDGSLRTNGTGMDPARFVWNAFGNDRHGRPYGGGRADKGGFQIPLEDLSAPHSEAALWAFVQQYVRGRLSRVVPELTAG